MDGGGPAVAVGEEVLLPRPGSLAAKQRQHRRADVGLAALSQYQNEMMKYSLVKGKKEKLNICAPSIALKLSDSALM